MSRLQIQTKNRKFETAKDLYGIFFEDINRAGDSGLYPELLRNRTFEDSLLPEDYREKGDGVHVVTCSGWEDEFNNGEGLSYWVTKNKIAPTPIPAWYTEHAQMELEREDTLNANRSAALRVHFEAGGCVYNTGFHGIPQKEGEAYPLYFFAKSDRPVCLEFSIEKDGHPFAQSRLNIGGNGYVRYDAILVSDGDCENASLVIRSQEESEVLFGFISLMPGKTYNGHGLRLDLVEKLKGLSPRFMRFPGGCIVEGSTLSTVMMFKNTIGPVWERPGHQLVWHYRSYNGLGYHEYLQLCEDLDMEPMYVCNCGMTCQGRRGTLLVEEELDEMLQDTLNAMEYALGPVDSKWGKQRAAMGHPAPFKLTYLEIGNENWGPDYEERYKLFYQEIKKRYPQIKTIANAHVEEHGCPAECVDEHFYNNVEFFTENVGYYDSYDRQGPGIFVGEQAVNEGIYAGKLYAALGEAAFLVGLERNQDIVHLASYAPLFENVNYDAWFPNLIRFDNHRSFGIPTYYVWRMFGQNRGKYVVESTQESGVIYRPMKGMASLKAKKALHYRNPVWEGEPTAVTHELMGHVKETGEGFCLEMPDEQQKEFFLNKMRWADAEKSFVIFGEEDQTCGRFEVEVLVEEDLAFEIGVFSARVCRSFFDQLQETEQDAWHAVKIRPFLWKIKDGKCSFGEPAFLEDRKLTDDFTIDAAPGEYHRFAYETDGQVIRLFVDGALLREIKVPSSPSFISVVTETEEEVIIKAVNMSGEMDPVSITLDCDVESLYKVTLLTGEKDAENSFEKPKNVRDRMLRLRGAGESFVYEAPAYSVSVLHLNKKM